MQPLLPEPILHSADSSEASHSREAAPGSQDALDNTHLDWKPDGKTAFRLLFQLFPVVRP